MSYNFQEGKVYEKTLVTIVHIIKETQKYQINLNFLSYRENKYTQIKLKKKEKHVNILPHNRIPANIKNYTLKGRINSGSLRKRHIYT